MRIKELERGSLHVGMFKRWNVRRAPTPSRSERAKEAAPPRFFVSVASTRLAVGVSRLFAAVARESASVASKGFIEADCGQEGNWVRADDFEGVGRTALGEGMWAGRQGSVPEQQSHYSRSVPIVK